MFPPHPPQAKLSKDQNRKQRKPKMRDQGTLIWFDVDNNKK